MAQPATSRPAARCRKRWAQVLWACLVCLLAGWPGGAAFAQVATQPAEPGSDLRIFLLTMGPGDEIWEKFGHNAIAVLDNRQQTAIAYNYGMFDFNEGDFLIRFIRGQMRYWMEGIPLDYTVEQYRQAQRTVWAQELDLTPAQRQKLDDFLQWNALPQNRYYTYDYYRDNCSTRVRDAIDMAVGGQLQQQLTAIPTDTTYRWHTRRIMADDVPLYTCLEFILGHPVDRKLSAWEEAFLPVRFMGHLGQVRLRDEQGRSRPLVKGDRRTLYEALRPADAPPVPGQPSLARREGDGRWYVPLRPPERQQPPSWTGWYLLAGVVWGTLLALLAREARRSRPWRWVFVALAVAWALLLGGAGLFLGWAWGFADHVAVRDNENLFYFSPVALALLVLIPALAAGRRWARRPVLGVMGLVLASALVGLALKVLPAFHQFSGELIALTVPANLALAWAVWRLGVGPVPASAPFGPAKAPAPPPRPSHR